MGGAYFWEGAYYRSLISSLQQMRLLLGGAYYRGALIIGSLRYYYHEQQRLCLTIFLVNVWTRKQNDHFLQLRLRRKKWLDLVTSALGNDWQFEWNGAHTATKLLGKMLNLRDKSAQQLLSQNYILYANYPCF